MKMAKLKIIILILIISLVCVQIHTRSEKEMNAFRYRMYISKQHNDSVFKSINTNLDNIQSILNRY